MTFDNSSRFFLLGWCRFVLFGFCCYSIPSKTNLFASPFRTNAMLCLQFIVYTCDVCKCHHTQIATLFTSRRTCFSTHHNSFVHTKYNFARIVMCIMRIKDDSETFTLTFCFIARSLIAKRLKYSHGIKYFLYERQVSLLSNNIVQCAKL